MKLRLVKAVLFSIISVIILLGCDFGGLKDDYVVGPVTPDGRRYTVSFNANGGSGTLPASQTAQSGESIITFEFPRKGAKVCC